VLRENAKKEEKEMFFPLITNYHIEYALIAPTISDADGTFTKVGLANPRIHDEWLALAHSSLGHLQTPLNVLLLRLLAGDSCAAVSGGNIFVGAVFERARDVATKNWDLLALDLSPARVVPNQSTDR
jgi:hypothetical protein